MPVSCLRTPLLVALVAVVAGTALLLRPEAVRAEPAEPATPPAEATVQVDGIATATGRPDLLRVAVGVEATAEAVGEALQQADDAARRALEALRSEGVAEADVQTVHMSIHPTYTDDGQEITGYTARHDVEVILRDLDRAGEVISVLADTGGNAVRLQGVAYALEDDVALQAEARTEAFAAARVRAAQLATLSGRELGDVVEVREQLTPTPPMPYAAADSGGAEALAVALSPGSASVTVAVAVRWSLR